MRFACEERALIASPASYQQTVHIEVDVIRTSISLPKMMRFLAIFLAVLAPATSFSFNGAPLRQSTSVSGTATMERQTIKSGARSMTMMPIGVPKVAYKMPGSRGGEWVDIYNRLTRERIIFMGAEIDDEMANQIIGVLLVSV